MEKSNNHLSRSARYILSCFNKIIVPNIHIRLQILGRVSLLGLDQPQFADKCPNKIYDQFSQGEWAKLEAQHPGVFEDKHMLSTLRKLAK